MDIANDILIFNIPLLTFTFILLGKENWQKKFILAYTFSYFSDHFLSQVHFASENAEKIRAKASRKQKQFQHVHPFSIAQFHSSPSSPSALNTCMNFHSSFTSIFTCLPISFSILITSSRFGTNPRAAKIR